MLHPVLNIAFIKYDIQRQFMYYSMFIDNDACSVICTLIICQNGKQMLFKFFLILAFIYLLIGN